MSRARDRADGVDLSPYAPLASPAFTGTPNFSGITAFNLPADKISGNAIDGGSIGVNTSFEGTVIASANLDAANGMVAGGLIRIIDHDYNYSSISPGDTSWNTILTFNGGTARNGNRLMIMAWINVSANNGYGQLSCFSSASYSKLYEHNAGTSQVNKTTTGLLSFYQPVMDLFEPTSTDSSTYYVKFAKEGGTFKANDAGRSWGYLIELGGVA